MNTSTENISYDISEVNKVVIAVERGGTRGGGRGGRRHAENAGGGAEDSQESRVAQLSVG